MIIQEEKWRGRGREGRSVNALNACVVAKEVLLSTYSWQKRQRRGAQGSISLKHQSTLYFYLPARLRLNDSALSPTSFSVQMVKAQEDFPFSLFPFSFFTPRSDNRSQSLQKEKPVHSCVELLETTHTALGESPRTPLAPRGTEKAETHPHKSNLRGLSPPHLSYPHHPFPGRWYSSHFLLGSWRAV